MATYNPVGPTALSLPIFKKLANRRVVLASASPRRKEIFANAVRSDPTTSYANHETVYMLIQIYQTKKGFFPEIVPSTFAEDLPHSRFQGHLADYPIATGAEKVCTYRIRMC